MFTLTLPFPLPKQTRYSRGTSHSYYLPQDKHNLIILYQGKASQLNICLKADVIICQSEQVDRILDFCTFIPFNMFNQCFPRCLCMGNRGFRSEDLNWSRYLCMGHREFDTNRMWVSAKSNCFIF